MKNKSGQNNEGGDDEMRKQLSWDRHEFYIRWWPRQQCTRGDGSQRRHFLYIGTCSQNGVISRMAFKEFYPTAIVNSRHLSIHNQILTFLHYFFVYFVCHLQVWGGKRSVYALIRHLWSIMSHRGQSCSSRTKLHNLVWLHIFGQQTMLLCLITPSYNALWYIGTIAFSIMSPRTGL